MKKVFRTGPLTFLVIGLLATMCISCNKDDEEEDNVVIEQTEEVDECTDLQGTWEETNDDASHHYKFEDGIMSTWNDEDGEIFEGIQVAYTCDGGLIDTEVGDSIYFEINGDEMIWRESEEGDIFRTFKRD